MIQLCLKLVPLFSIFFATSILKLLAQTEPENLFLHHRFVADTTTNRNEATVATSGDGQIVLTYKDERGSGNLYITRLIGNEWTRPEQLSKPLNTTGWEPNQFISEDGNTLYFTSTHAGGFGGKDIYVSKKLQNGEWGEARNLGAGINTPFDEEAPIIYSDGRTLFFSSNRNKQQCCFDNFSSTLLKDTLWTKPVRVGYPVSTTEKTEHVENKNDTYMVTFFNEKKSPFTILKGKVLDITGEVLECVTIKVSDNATGKVAGVYDSNYQTGDYAITLLSGRRNTITYESDGCIIQTETIDVTNEVGYFELHDIVKMWPVVAENLKQGTKANVLKRNY